MTPPPHVTDSITMSRRPREMLKVRTPTPQQTSPAHLPSPTSTCEPLWSKKSESHVIVLLSSSLNIGGHCVGILRHVLSNVANIVAKRSFQNHLSSGCSCSTTGSRSSADVGDQDLNSSGAPSSHPLPRHLPSSPFSFSCDENSSATIGQWTC